MGFVRTSPCRDGAHAGGPFEPMRFLARASGLMILLLILCAWSIGLFGYPPHALIPLLLPAQIWVMAMAFRAACHGGDRKRRERWLTGTGLGIAAIAFLARLLNLVWMEPFCNICRWGIPYDGLARELRAAGFSGRGTIITVEHDLAGNLRAQFPEARVVNVHWPPFAPPVRTPAQRRETVLVWSPTRFDLAFLRARALRFLARECRLSRGGALPPARTVAVPWQHLWRPEGYRRSLWRIIRLPEAGARGRCGGLAAQGPAR